ncbi:MAG: hypothetical protein ACW98Y_11915 [Candidatus Thorarchaeota archaeon]|jgi:predicted Zn-ribbon and HTH transcriptional regulator
MDDWKKKLMSILVKLEHPMGVDWICSMLRFSPKDKPLVWEEIVRIGHSLRGTQRRLVIKKGKCTSCFNESPISEEWITACWICKTGFVTAPKVCILSDDQIVSRGGRI